MTWRVGNHYGIHVYDGDKPVATFHRPEDAKRAVDAVNVSAGNGVREVGLNPHTYAQEYEFRSDEVDYTPTEAERGMIEDAICGYLSELEAAAITPAESAAIREQKDATE